MTEQYKTIYKNGSGEFINKKSKFIADVFSIDKEETAIELIEQIKKKHYNASHHCYAYIIGRNQEIMRYSDDGEPGGTAGKPMLDQLIAEKLHNTLVVVTRYFGGTLLGTGGLVRSYQSAVKEGLSNSVIAVQQSAAKLQILTDYNVVGKLLYTIEQMNLKSLDVNYTDIVTAVILVPLSVLDLFIKKWTAITNGSPKLTILCDVYFAELDNSIILFESQ